MVSLSRNHGIVKVAITTGLCDDRRIVKPHVWKKLLVVGNLSLGLNGKFSEYKLCSSHHILKTSVVLDTHYKPCRVPTVHIGFSPKGDGTCIVLYQVRWDVIWLVRWGGIYACLSDEVRYTLYCQIRWDIRSLVRQDFGGYTLLCQMTWIYAVCQNSRSGICALWSDEDDMRCSVSTREAKIGYALFFKCSYLLYLSIYFNHFFISICSSA